MVGVYVVVETSLGMPSGANEGLFSSSPGLDPSVYEDHSFGIALPLMLQIQGFLTKRYVC